MLTTSSCDALFISEILPQFCLNNVNIWIMFYTLYMLNTLYSISVLTYICGRFSHLPLCTGHWGLLYQVSHHLPFAQHFPIYLNDEWKLVYSYCHNLGALVSALACCDFHRRIQWIAQRCVINKLGVMWSFVRWYHLYKPRIHIKQYSGKRNRSTGPYL